MADPGRRNAGNRNNNSTLTAAARKGPNQPPAGNSGQGKGGDQISLSQAEKVVSLVILCINLAGSVWGAISVGSVGSLRKEMNGKVDEARQQVVTQLTQSEQELKKLGNQFVLDLKRESELLAKKRAECADKWSKSWDALHGRMAKQHERITLIKEHHPTGPN